MLMAGLASVFRSLVASFPRASAISRTRIEQRRRLPGTHGRRAPPPGRRAWGAGQNACAADPQLRAVPQRRARPRL